MKTVSPMNAQSAGQPSPSHGGSGKRPNRTAARLSLRRILVPLDFSGKSRQALDFAVPLAQRYGAKIFLIHVVEPLYSFASFPGEMGVAPVNLRPVAEAWKAKLSALAQQLVPREVLGKTMVCSGRAYHKIVEAANAVEADLIVIATHGHTGLRHVFLGSTAEHVVRHARCPVLAVRRR
jgi:nucleotide-binding universal stress UspA family protein